MEVSVSIIRHTLEILLTEIYPDVSELDKGYYTLDDILNQLIFEIIKEDYKANSKKHIIQYYLEKYNDDNAGSSRKFTRATQYTQFYRDFNNNEINEMFGIRLSELDAQDMSGSNKFQGYQLTEQEFLGIRMQAYCKLTDKLHGKQISDSHKVSEAEFKKLFTDYSEQIEWLEPMVNAQDQEDIICRTFAYYGLETHFLTEFLYRTTLAAEKAGFPDEIPVDRILPVCGVTPYLQQTSWCPEVLIADLCIIPKWNLYCTDFYSDSQEEWNKKLCLLLDCKQLKNIVLQRKLDKWIEYMHSCSAEDKANFIIEHYWLWDYRPNYEWTSERIKYYRKLYQAVTRDFSQPHIK